MKKNKFIYIFIILILFSFSFGCGEKTGKNNDVDKEKSENRSELLNYVEALKLFEEGVEAEVLDINNGNTFKIRRVIGGFNTIADIETMSLEDTEIMLEATDGKFSIIRRPVVVTIGDIKLPASIAPFEHSGSENHKFSEIIDNRSGATGTGINLDSIRGNGLIGVVDIYFYNSLIPGLNRIDERHQEMVLKAYDYLY